ncbi:MAG: O-methyltransferase [Bacteroidales bacterium]|nr:O-methyltransferase [Bacteroidales bacterium]
MYSKSIEKYIEDHTSPESDLLQRLNRETHLKLVYPRMLSGHVQGKFLEMISNLLKPESILEIGTFTGYSAICLANGLSDTGKIITIEINPELEPISGKYFRQSGVEKKIVQYFGDALDIIPVLTDVFDLVFIDANKENYLDYYQLVFNKVKPGGLILVDNALWDGKVTEPGKKHDKETEGINRLNNFVQNDDRVENILLPLRDGIMMIRKK